jgi:hypothetical protein
MAMGKTACRSIRKPLVWEPMEDKTPQEFWIWAP